MAYHERDYSRDGSGGGRDLGMKILRALNWSFSIGTYLRIRVRVHISFVIVLGLMVLTMGEPLWMLRISAILFGSVLLHEFGHCLACRRVGGEADDILMWPLGGLAFCRPPHRPGAEFWTVAWGPLVNVILAGVSLVTVLAWRGTDMPMSFNPLRPYLLDFHGGLSGVLADVFVVNYFLLLFNLFLIFYPFDGGRLVQIALWAKFGYVKSMRFASSFGMVGAVLVGVLGLIVGRMLLVFIAIFGGYACWQQKQALRHGAYEGAEWQYGGGAAMEPAATKPGFLERRRQERARRARQREQTERHALDAEVDRILEKVHREGIQSLSAKEKRILQKASEERK